MDKTVAGQAFNIMVPADSSGGTALQNELRLNIKYLERTFKETGHTLRAFTSIMQNAQTGASEYVTRLFSNAPKDMMEGARARLDDRLFGGSIARGIGTIDRAVADTDLTARNTRLKDKRSLAGIRVMDVYGNAGVEYDKNTDMLSMLFEKGDKKTRGSINAFTREGRKREKEGQEMLTHLYAAKKPGTEEFNARVEQGLEAQAARDKAAVAWAKKNRKNPLAKSIIKRKRGISASGKILNKAKAVTQWVARNAAVLAIGTAVTTAVKFLAHLPAVAANVHKISMKGQTYNMPEHKVREYEAIEKSMRLDSGVFSSVFGGIVSELSDIVTGGMSNTISKVAALLSMDGKAPIDAIVRYTTGTDKDAEKLFREMFNSAMRISFQGKDTAHRQGGLSFSAALSENAHVVEKAFPGMGNILLGLGNYAEKHLTKEQLEAAKGSDDIFEYITSTIAKAAKASAETATDVEHNEADRVAGVFAGVSTTLASIRDGILTQILAACEPIVSWLMVMAKGILANPIFGGRFDGIVASLDAADNEKNEAALAANTIYLRTLETSVPALAAKLGYNTPELREAVLHDFEKFGTLPVNIHTQEQLNEFLNYAGLEKGLRTVRETDRKLNYEITKYKTGSAESLTEPGKMDLYELGSTAVVPNVTAGQLGIRSSGVIRGGTFEASLYADEILAEKGPMTQQQILYRMEEIDRQRGELAVRTDREWHSTGLYKDTFIKAKVDEAVNNFNNKYKLEEEALHQLYLFGKDGTPAKLGEIRTYFSNAARREQGETTTELTVVEAIVAHHCSMPCWKAACVSKEKRRQKNVSILYIL